MNASEAIRSLPTCALKLAIQHHKQRAREHQKEQAGHVRQAQALRKELQRRNREIRCED